MWICKKCETYNDDTETVCCVCNFNKEQSAVIDINPENMNLSIYDRTTENKKVIENEVDKNFSKKSCETIEKEAPVTIDYDKYYEDNLETELYKRHDWEKKQRIKKTLITTAVVLSVLDILLFILNK